MHLVEHIKEHAVLGILADPRYRGQGHTIEVVSCGAGLMVGDAVYINGPNSVAPAIATTLATSKVAGFVISKEETDECTIVTTGLILGLSGVIPNTQYFLSMHVAGAITDTPPTGSGAYVVHVGVGWDTDSILLNISHNPTRRRA